MHRSSRDLVIRWINRTDGNAFRTVCRKLYIGVEYIKHYITLERVP